MCCLVFFQDFKNTKLYVAFDFRNIARGKQVIGAILLKSFVKVRELAQPHLHYTSIVLIISTAEVFIDYLVQSTCTNHTFGHLYPCHPRIIAADEYTNFLLEKMVGGMTMVGIRS